MANHKGAKKVGGRIAGTPNKLTQDLREMIKQAFHEAGGVQYLVTQSKLEPVAFMSLIGKVIPQEVKATVDGNITIEIIKYAAN